MAKYRWFIIFTGLLGVLLCGCTGERSTTALSVCGGIPVMYKTDQGDHITARYFSLSDRSLEFVKLTLPGGREYTLPEVMSASGVRYTDERELVWWTKGNTAFTEIRDINGEWKKIYDCKEIPIKNGQSGSGWSL